MQKKLVMVATAVATVAVFAAACSKSSSSKTATPTPGNFKLVSGTYQFTPSSIPVNDCVSSSLNGALVTEGAATFDITNTANNGTFTLSATGTLAELIPPFNGTITGDTINGNGTVVLAVPTTGTIANGSAGCSLRITATIPGTLVADNTFSDTITTTITADPAAGANCGSIKVENIFPLTLAAGTSSCNLSIAGQAAITASTAAFSLSNRY